MLAVDLFNDTNGTALSSHTMDIGSGWTEQQGTWQIQSNSAQLVASAGDGQCVAHTTTTVSNIDITVDLLTGTSPDAGIIFNYVDINNYWMWIASSFGTGFLLYRREGGAFGLHGTYTGLGTPAAATVYTLRVITLGDIVYCYVNSTLAIEYRVNNRVHKTAVKHGIRAYNGDTSKFQGFALEEGVYDTSSTGFPKQLAFTNARTKQTLLNAFDDSFLVLSDNFPTSLAAYTPITTSGTVNTSLSSGQVTFTGASTGRKIMQANVLGAAPYMFVKMTVTASSSGAVPHLGFWKDANNYCYAYVYNGQVGVDSKNNGVSGANGPIGSFTAPYTIVFALSYPEIWAWVDTGSGFVPIIRGAMQTGVDLKKLINFSTDWKPFFAFDMTSSGATGTIEQFRVGYIGGVNVRDMKPVVTLDGLPYIHSNKIYYYTTIASGNDFLTNHSSIMAVDLTTYAAEIVTQVFFNVNSLNETNTTVTPDTCTALYGGQVIYDGTKWMFCTNGWGYQTPSTGVKLWYSETTTDITVPGTVLTLNAYQLVVSGSSKSLYDSSVRVEAGTWYVTCAETNTLTGWSQYYCTLLSGPNLQTLTLIAQDTSVNSAEQQCWVRIGTNWYISSGGTSGPHYWDSSLNYLGSLANTINLSGTNVSFGAFGAGYIVAPISTVLGIQYTLVLFSDDEYLSSNATKGQLVVMTAEPVLLNQNQSFGDTFSFNDVMDVQTNSNYAEDELLRTELITRTVSRPELFVSTLSYTDSMSAFIPRKLADTFDRTDEMVGLLVHPMIPDTLTYTDSTGVRGTLNLRTGDLRTVFDSLSVSFLVQLQLSETLARTESMLGFVSHNISDTLSFTDVMTGEQVNPIKDAIEYTDLIDFVHAATMYYADTLFRTDELFVSQTQNRSWIDELNRTDHVRAVRTRFGVFSDSLTFSDGMIRDRIFKVLTDTLDRTETFTVIKNAVGYNHDLLTFTDEMDVSATAKLSIEDEFALNDDFYIYKSGSGIKIFGKFRNICLKSPEFNDFVANQSKLVVPRAMPGNFRTYIKRTASDKLHWQFIMQKPKKDELEQFIETEINNDLLIYDWLGRRWKAKLTTDSYDFVELARWSPGGNKFEVTLEFEGVRYYG